LAPAADGCVLTVWAVPGASRAGIVGLHGGALRIRLSAPAEGGAANRELVRLLAARLGVRAANLSLEAGAASRRKHMRVRGLAVEEARARLGPIVSVDSSAAET
jgi:hypothetical protein